MEDVMIRKSRAIKAGMEKPYVCVLTEGSSQLASATLEVIPTKSLNEAKIIFRTRPMACLMAPLTFKGSNLTPFLEWFRGHFPKVLTVRYGKGLVRDELRLQNDANLILVPSSHLEHVLEVAERALKKRTFTLDLEAIWPETANCSSPWVRKVLRYLSESENFLQIKSVREVADHFGITEAHLLRNFDRHFSLSLKQLIICLKLCYAAWLRQTTTLRTEGIALICGFYDGHHLSRLFRQKVGCSLSVYSFEQSWQKTWDRFNNNLQMKSTQ